MVTDAMRVGPGSLIKSTLPVSWGSPLDDILCMNSEIVNKAHGGSKKKLSSFSSAQNTEAPTLSVEYETASEISQAFNAWQHGDLEATKCILLPGSHFLSECKAKATR